jgi:L-ascorbate metabolism protein UlaG (beta-lactamase superfamily)
VRRVSTLGALVFVIASVVMFAKHQRTLYGVEGCDSDHHWGGRFHNIDMTPPTRTFATEIRYFLKASLYFQDRPLLNRTAAVAGLSGNVSLRCGDDQLCITWIGQSTILLQTSGKNILFDPFWSERASPFSFVGPRRTHPPGIRLDALPRIDAVVLTHDHYDHLDKSTVIELQRRFAPLFLTPLGVDRRLREWGISRIQAGDWWNQISLADLKFILVPAQHHSGRGLFDENLTLWSGWIILTPKYRVYFLGDGGYNAWLLKDTARRYAPFDAAILPIGDYDDLWAEYHMNPEQAIQAFQDVRGSVLIPVHWLTVPLAAHPLNEPIERFRNELTRLQIPAAAFRLPRVGEHMVFGELDFSNARYSLQRWRQPAAPATVSTLR